MRSWLRTVMAFIKDNGVDRGRVSRRLEDKVEQVRDIAFEIQDALDEIVLHSTRVFHRHKITKAAHEFGHNIWHGFPLNGISEKIANIKAKIEDIKSQAAAFSDGCSSSKSELGYGSWNIGHWVSPLLLDDEMVGYTKLKESFMIQLMDGEKGLVTLAVVGPGGSGKNTLWKPMIRGRF